MKYGYFNDQDKEYVITAPDTPAVDQLSGKREFLFAGFQYRRGIQLL
jgi:cellobiose phosphorylase